MKKAILIGVSIFLAIVVAITAIYMVRKPSVVTLPSPTPKASMIAKVSPVPAPVFQVSEGQTSCNMTFNVACAETHRACNPTTFACETVNGPGEDTCTSDAQCTTTQNHYACNTTTNACELVSGPGANSCTDNDDCNPDIPEASLDCVVKRMYSDDSRNRAGFYYREIEIVDSSTVQNDQTILYNVVARNNGDNSVPDVVITDTLSTNLTYVDGDSGCTYDSSSRQITCTIGTLAPNSEANRSFRARVAVSGVASVANTAEVSSTNGQRDSCSVRVDATGRVSLPPSSAPDSLPEAGVFEVTTGTIGIGLILLIAGALGLLLI